MDTENGKRYRERLEKAQYICGFLSKYDTCICD